GVLKRAAVDGECVYFGCRDGHAYCLERKNGQLRWKLSLGSPIVASPAVAPGHSVFFIASEGRIVCVDPQTGKADWTFTELEKFAPLLVSSPTLVVKGG